MTVTDWTVGCVVWCVCVGGVGYSTGWTVVMLVTPRGP